MTAPIPVLGVSRLSTAAPTAEPRAPRTTVEQAVVEIWRQVLPERAISPDSDFFDLGGDSLSATQIATRVQQVLGVTLDLRLLLDQPTPAAMAVIVEAALATRPPAAAEPIPVVDRSQPLPLSFTQERLWFIHQLDPQNAAYTIATAVRLQGQVDLPAFEAAFSALVARHETLRTTFQLVAGEPRQFVQPAQPFTVAVVDDAGPLAAAQALAERDAQAPFDLAHGPLLRATLYRIDPNDQVLLIAMHHIISDAWSLGVLAREVLALYAAARQGVVAELPPLPVQFADFAAWQRTALPGAALERELAYWRPQLAGLTRLELPLDHPRPAAQHFHGALESAEVDPALLLALRRFSQSAGVTLTMTLLAAFHVLLVRYTGQTDVAVGLPIANRRDVALEGLIGAFVNTLVLRVDLSGGPTFRAALAQVRRAALEAYAHQDMPFAKLVVELNPERSLSYSPLVSVMFNHINVPQPAAPTGAAAAEGLVLDRGAAQFDLTLTVIDPGPSSRRERLVVEYNTDLFEPATAARLLRHYLNILRAIAADPDQTIATLPVLDADERRQLLVDWNATARPYPAASLPDLFESQVARTPAAVALIEGERRLSYADLNAHANQFAHALRRLGSARGAILGVCLPRSCDQIAAVLAVLKTGAAYLPLDPAYPAARLHALMADSGAALVLTDAAGATMLADMPGVRCLLLDDLAGPLTDANRANLGVTIDLDAPAYLIYTSGSSGLPKGVLAPHRGAVNHCQWLWEEYPFAAGEVVAHKTSLNFVDAVVEIFGALLGGVPLALVPEAVVRDPAALVNALAQFGVTRLLLLPALLRALLRGTPNLRARLPRLRLVAASGEPLDSALVAEVSDALPGVTLLNWYGASEVAGDATSFDCRAAQPGADVPIGRPLANTQVYVLDPVTLEPTPIGVAGEIYVSGDGLALGYPARPDLNAQRFGPNPFSSQPGARLYGTGDRGCWQADGNLRYLGRRDRQVKVRGVRIELDEIQAVLAGHPAVAAGAVTTNARGGGADPEVAAYYVARPHAQIVPADVRRHLAEQLPESMLPAWIVPLPDLPRLPNGKVDLAGLPAPEVAPRTSAAGAPVSPRTALEAGLAQLWAEVLGRPVASVTDNFFELGGHSLLAASLFARLKADWGADLPLAALFADPTVAGLAAALVHGGQAAGLTSLVPLQPHGRRPPFFCVHPLGGGVGDYAPLARQLHPEQPFYGLRAKGLDDVRWQAASFEALAADYVAEIRQLQPDGPYRLGGYSSGGLIAYEMARQLVTAGQAVSVLALLDSYAPLAPGRNQSVTAIARRRIANLPHWLRDQSRLGHRQLLHKLRYWGRSSRPGRAPLTAADYVGEADLRRLPPLHQAFVEAHWRALTGYRPQPYVGRVTLFRAQAQALSRVNDPDKGWGALALGGVDIREFPGSHRTLLTEPWVNGLARVLQQRLDELDLE